MTDSLELEVQFEGGPDKERRFNVLVRGKSCGQLQMERGDATRFLDLLFGKNYKVSKSLTNHA